MRKGLPFHPICFALFPILYLYSRNLALFPLTDLVRPATGAVVCAAAIFGLVWLIVRDVDRAAAVTSLAIIEFCTFNLALQLANGVLSFGMEVTAGTFVNYWWPLAFLSLVALGWKWKRPIALTGFLNVVGAVLVILPTCTIALGILRIRRELASLKLPPQQASAPIRGDAQPDVFYIILDGYGREDALQRYFGFSNRPFVEALEKRGFYVAKESRSNYCQTELSLASSLNMDFISNLVKSSSIKFNLDRAPLDKLLDNNAVARNFRAHGYEYVSITSGFPGVHPLSADILLSGPVTLSLFESSLLDCTPLQSSPQMESLFDARREHLVGALDNLLNMDTRGLRPRFVFAHVLAPHPPFVLDAGGKPIRQHKIPFGYWDASAFFDVGGTQDEYHNGYLGQLQYVNRRILEIVDKLKKESPQPIIILQGDHGSRMHLDQVSLAKSDVREAFRNFNAYLVPGSVRSELYAGITPVNAFRVLFDALYADSLSLKPDTSYFTSWDHPYSPIDVTRRVLKPLWLPKDRSYGARSDLKKPVELPLRGRLVAALSHGGRS